VSAVKRLQIMIEKDLDDLLGRQARAEGCSKAALVRRYVRERLRISAGDDSLRGMAGMYRGRPADDIDEVVYGGRYRDLP
jgi:hypothetical protein